MEFEKLVSFLAEEDKDHIQYAIRSLTSICNESKEYSARMMKSHLSVLNEIFVKWRRDDDEIISLLLRLFSAFFSNAQNLTQYVYWGSDHSPSLLNLPELMDCISDNSINVSTSCLLFLSELMKSFPLIDEVSGNNFWTVDFVKVVCKGLFHGCAHNSVEIIKTSLELAVCFVSEHDDFFTSKPIVDPRKETNLDRKRRIALQRAIKERSILFATTLVDLGFLDKVAPLLLDERQNIHDISSIVVSKVIHPLDIQYLKNVVGPLMMYGHDSVSNIRGIFFQCAVFYSKPELLMWSIEKNGGIGGIDGLLIENNPLYDFKIAELFSLLSQSDEGRSLISPLFENGECESLLNSKNSATKAFALSALLKLSLKPTSNSHEVDVKSLTKNVIPLLKSLLDITKSVSTENSQNTAPRKHTEDVILDRAIEVIALLSYRTEFKQLLTSRDDIMALCLSRLREVVDKTGYTATMSFGISTIINNIAVTNQELQKKLLSEKDVTVEQYEQLQKLQQANSSESATAAREFDSADLCRNRVLRIADMGFAPLLCKFAIHGSQQTQETALCALCRIAVVDSIRGLLIQQGLLKSCVSLFQQEKLSKATKMYCCHIVAKLLVTTNPNMLDDQIRLSCIAPLLLLCRESDASNLQQFESLLSLANILSCSETEIGVFCHLKGIGAVKYLMFSDHSMVKRAATEVFCNIAGFDQFIEMFLSDENSHYWLRLAEDFEDCESTSESYLCARAAAGTLAISSQDCRVGEKLVTMGIVSTIEKLLLSGDQALIERGLFILSQISSNNLSQELRRQIFESQILALLVALELQDDGGIAESIAPIVELLSQA